MKKARCTLIVVLSILTCLPFASAQDKDEGQEGLVSLEKIVVTPYRYEEALSKTASSVSIISPGEIKNSNAQKVADLFVPIPGMTVQDWYGNGAKASVDMAGFGEQAGLNVLVLVDGRRVNDVDLSGVDWSQIPLDQVEHIEIIRGGAGGVLYGDNASSGVINIITKKGAGKPKLKMQVDGGSYSMNKQKITFDGSIDKKLSYLFNVGRESTNGYRDNSFDKSGDFASKIDYKFNDDLGGRFDFGYHASSYGMPSGLFQHHIDEHSRRWARYGDDHAKNKDLYFVLGNNIDFSQSGRMDIDFSYRHKKADSMFPTSGNDTRKNKIDTFGVTPKYTLDREIFERDNKLITGIDFYRVIYTSDNFSPTTDAFKNYTNINKNSIAAYLQDEFSISKKLTLVAGFRYEAARYAFGYHDFTGSNPDRDAKLQPKMRAYNSGLVYNYKDESSIFFNVGKSFRFPEVDEFTGMYDINFHQFLNTDLKPQSALNYQLGARHKFNGNLKMNISVFRMNVKDYIYFNPTGGQWGYGENENYSNTYHQGLETGLEARFNSRTTFFANYTFTDAYFGDGLYSKNEIPMVARHKASTGLRFLLLKDVAFNVTGTYVGKRYFINDQANAVSRLNGYMVADTNISWNSKNLSLIFGIDNLFDREYSEYGVYGTDSSKGFVYDKCYFPSPGRNFSIRLEYKF